MLFREHLPGTLARRQVSPGRVGAQPPQ